MASNTAPEEVLKFKAVKEDLHALLDKVLEDTQNLQATAEEPLAIDLEWIFQKMRDHGTTEKYLLEPRAIKVEEGLGNLLKLPRELRDSIYGYAIADGTTAILRASRQAHQEASELVFSKGICRLAFGFESVFADELCVTNPRLKYSVTKKIQNVDIRVNARGSCIGKKYLPILKMFNGSIQRKECVVRLECDPFYGDMDVPNVIHALEKFTGFEQVELQLDFQWYGDRPDPLDDLQSLIINGRMDGTRLRQQRILEPSLGEGAWGLDGDMPVLTFSPRK